MGGAGRAIKPAGRTSLLPYSPTSVRAELVEALPSSSSQKEVEPFDKLVLSLSKGSGRTEVGIVP